MANLQTTIEEYGKTIPIQNIDSVKVQKEIGKSSSMKTWKYKKILILDLDSKNIC